MCPSACFALTRSSSTDHIAHFLAARIRDGDLLPGTRLPTEQALAQQFEVSRPVVREAISRVKADGLVRSKQGSGLYVADLLERRSFKVDDDVANDVPSILRLFELRLPMELSAVRLAAARCTPGDIVRLDRAHAELVEADDWGDTGVVADLSFHHAIAVATQNSFYADFMAFLGGVLQNGVRVARAKSRQVDVRRITIDEHARILKAIRNRDPESAALAMHIHLEGASDRMSTGHAAEGESEL